MIVIPAKEILSGTGIGAAYKRMPMEFHLSNGVIAHVFEKNRPFTFDEATNFISKFTDLYPDWKDAYLNPLAESYLTASITTGDIWGNFEIDSDGKKIYAHPGEHTPTVAEWYFGDIRSLTFRMANRSCPAADGVVVQLENADGARVRIDLPNDASRKIITSDFSRKMGKIIIDKNQNSFCDKVEITEE
ncbi:hypothetical protein AA13595_2065 [Gluconacetobacter johannae DSM 13595]|nr:hypothetical protein AA13595_2065 [Gluconacetobacter johannae DSM 13595]